MNEHTHIQGAYDISQTNFENPTKLNFINEELAGTPFRIVGNDEQGFALTLGRHRVSKICKTKDETISQLQEDDWFIIFNMIATIIEMNEERQQEQKTVDKIKNKLNIKTP